MRIFKQKLTKSPADIILSHAQLATCKLMLKAPRRKAPPKGSVTHAGLIREHVANDMHTSLGIVDVVVNRKKGFSDYIPVMPDMQLAVHNTERHLRELKTGAGKLKVAKPRLVVDNTKKKAKGRKATKSARPLKRAA